MEGKKVERHKKAGDNSWQNRDVVHAYPLLLLYRLVYSMIPAILQNHPAIQVQAISILTLAYLIVYANLKTQKKLSDYYIDVFSEFMLLMMQTHLFWFIDGGIFNGTLN